MSYWKRQKKNVVKKTGATLREGEKKKKKHQILLLTGSESTSQIAV